MVEFVPQCRVLMRGAFGGNGRMRKPRRVVIAIASRNVIACSVMILFVLALLVGKDFELCGSNNNLSSCDPSICLSSSYG